MFHQNVLIALFCCWYIQGVSCLYFSISNIIELSPQNFETVLKSNNLWLVQFYAPWCGHCQKFVEEYKKVADGLEGKVKVAVVNGALHKGLLKRYNIKGFPTIKIFGKNKSKPIPYQGHNKFEDIINTILKIKHSEEYENDEKPKFLFGDVVQLDLDNFDMLVMKSRESWLVLFLSESCEICEDFRSEWLKIYKGLNSKVKIGVIDKGKSKTIAKKFKIREFPSILFVPAGEENCNLASKYTGKYAASNIIHWALTKATDGTCVPQVIDFETLKLSCDKKRYCIVSILPHLSDCSSNCRVNYLTILSNVGKKFKNKGWGWIWSEAGAQPHLEDSLGMGGQGYPTVVAVDVKKIRYSTFEGPFSVEAISKFLRNVSIGQFESNSISKPEVPKIESIDPWNEKDEL